MNKNATRTRTDLTDVTSLCAPLPLEYKFPVIAAIKNAIPTDKQITPYIQDSATTLIAVFPHSSMKMVIDARCKRIRVYARSGASRHPRDSHISVNPNLVSEN